VKPWFNPPNWLFGPVWTILYALMGIALGLVWDKGIAKKEVQTAIMVFGVQLALNVLWSIVFFGVQSLFYGLVIIILLWVVIAVTIVVFYKVSKKAGLLLIPYICWVTIATLLNLYVWLLNP
jgi:tryptophan-rich sensory protein